MCVEFKDKLMLHSVREIKRWWEVGEVGRWEKWMGNEVERWKRQESGEVGRWEVPGFIQEWEHRVSPRFYLFV